MEDYSLRISACVLWLMLLSGFHVRVASAQTQNPSVAQDSAAVPAAVGARSAPAFEVNAAVETYLAKMPASERARSNAYFEGGYWLQLWGFLSAVAGVGLVL